MELVLLNTVMDHLFTDLAGELASRSADPEAALKLCALADAVSVVIHCDWRTQARAEDRRDDATLQLYDAEVKAAIQLNDVRSASRRPLSVSRLSAADECRILAICHDHELEQFRQLLYNCVISL
jgi:hypothetical protein